MPAGFRLPTCPTPPGTTVPALCVLYCTHSTVQCNALLLTLWCACCARCFDQVADFGLSKFKYSAEMSAKSSRGTVSTPRSTVQYCIAMHV